MEVLDVNWRMALTGQEGKLTEISKLITVGQLATLLGRKAIHVIRNENIYKDHADVPFRNVFEPDASIDVVALSTDWPNPTRSMRWKDLDISDRAAQDHSLLRNLIALAPGEADGVRAKLRAKATVRFAVESRYLFFSLTRDVDVWFAYSKKLTVNGTPVEPRSIWLHADVHTPLQPVTADCDFSFPIVAAQYTEAHLRFELSGDISKEGPFRVEFDAVVAQLSTEPRHIVSTTDHVSEEGWALSRGCVAWAMHEPSFLRARIAVHGERHFLAPAPRLFEYCIAGDSREAAIVEGTATGAAAEGEFWRRAKCVYSGLQISRQSSPGSEHWEFVLCARRYQI